MDIIYLGYVLFVSMLLTVAFTPVSAAIARKYGFIDVPDKRKVHSRPTPRLGGLAMAITLFISLLLNVHISKELVGFFLGAFCVVSFGLIDDKKGIRPKIKYLLQLVPAAIFVFWSDIYIRSFGDILGLGDLRFGPLGPFVTIFCIAGVMNAINLSDGLDGLAAGKCMIASCFLFVFGYSHEHYLFSIFPVAIVGIVLGFLRFNSYPAKLFMGDTGSLLLGYTMAVISVALVEAAPNTMPIKPISMAIILALPIGDTLLVMGRRLIRGKSIFQADKSHFHHKLLKSGLDHPIAVATVYSIMFFFGGWAWFIRELPEWLQFYMTLALVVGNYLAVGILERIQFQRQSVSVKRVYSISSALSSRVMRRISLVFVIFFLVVTAQYVEQVPSTSLLSIGLALFIIAFFPWKCSKSEINVCSGIFYIVIFFLNTILWLKSYSGSFSHIYWGFFQALVWSWAFLIFLDFRYRRVVMPSAFEVLIILFSFVFIGIIFWDAFNMRIIWGKDLLVPALFSLPMFLITKAYLRRRHRLNRGMAFTFIIMLLIIGLRGLI